MSPCSTALKMAKPSVHRIIAGYGRSGTTWILDVLAEANSLRAIFEPLHPLHVDGAEAYAHRYIPEIRNEPKLYKFLHRYFCENYHSLWADYRVIKHHLLPRLRDLTSWQGCEQLLRRYLELKHNYSRFHRQRQNGQRIVKLIRANMMLPWLQATFDARIVFVIRHPAAVILSQMKAQRAWNPYEYIDRYRADSDLIHTLDVKTKRLLLQSIDEVEAYALCWCIENTVALEQAQRCAIPIVYYEQLVQRGIPEWQRIVSALELEQMPEERLISQPSQQTWGRKATDSTLLLKHASWMEDVDVSVSARIQRILDATGMQVYSVNDPLPVVSNDIGRSV